MEKLIQWLGWIGVLIILGCYFLLSIQVIGANHILYQSLNAIGAALIAIEAKTKKDYQPFWLNMVWMGIAIFSILKILTSI